MASIWDTPMVSGSPTTKNHEAVSDTTGKGGEVIGQRERHFGTQAGPRWTGEGYGVKNGVPRGDTEHDRVEALHAQYPFAASGAKRLDAATRKALGR